MRAEIPFILTFLFSSWLCAEPLRLKISVQEGFDKLQSVREVQEFVRISFLDENIDVTFTALPFARSSALASKGEIDGELLRASNIVEDFPNLMVLPKPLVNVSYRAVYREGREFHEDELRSYKGLVLLHSATTRDELRRRQMKVEEVATIEQGLRMVRTRRADFMILADPVIESVKANNAKAFAGLALAKEQFQKIPLYFVINKKHQGLVPKMEKALSQGHKTHLKKFKILPDVINPSL